MRMWRFWFNAIIWSSQHNPPQFIEILMTGAAIALLILWGITKNWPYMVLSSSFAIGAAVSIWVREFITPSSQQIMAQIIAVLLLFYSLYGFAELNNYFQLATNH